MRERVSQENIMSHRNVLNILIDMYKLLKPDTETF